MKLVGVEIIEEAQKRHADAAKRLSAWRAEVASKTTVWACFQDVRDRYPKTDKVGERYVFDIGGNRYRLIVKINFAVGVVGGSMVRHSRRIRQDQRGGGLDMARITPIRTEADHKAALARIDALMDAVVGSPEAEELSVLADLVEAYEAKHFPIELADTRRSDSLSNGAGRPRTARP